MADRPRIILAVDAGGSSTRCIVAGADGTVLGAGRGGPANHILSGWETARASIRCATAEAIESAGPVAERIDVAVAGSAGVGPNGEGREVVESLLAELVPNAAAVRATGDMVTAFWGALQVPVGVVVSAGTGSVCFGRNARGETCQVGGWGHIMGDEGSAYDIAAQALRAVARATDGRGAPTALSARLIGALGVQSAIEAAIRVYAEPLSRDQIAALAVLVAAAADDGDAAARAILGRAGEELALAALAALRRLDLLHLPASVSYAGAVFDAGELITGPFATAIREGAPAARLEPPALPPIGGAFRLGLEAIGEPMSDGATARLRGALEEVGGRHLGCMPEK